MISIADCMIVWKIPLPLCSQSETEISLVADAIQAYDVFRVKV